MVSLHDHDMVVEIKLQPTMLNGEVKEILGDENILYMTCEL